GNVAWTQQTARRNGHFARQRPARGTFAAGLSGARTWESDMKMYPMCNGPLQLSAIAAAVAMLLAAPSTSVKAQEAGAQAPTSVEEIVVTGSRIRQRED